MEGRGECVGGGVACAAGDPLEAGMVTVAAVVVVGFMAAAEVTVPSGWG